VLPWTISERDTRRCPICNRSRFDRIKIDRSFIACLGQTDRSLAIVRAIIGLAHGLGLPALAEAVETNDQLATLISEGCDETQGFLIGRPRPIEVYADIVGHGGSLAQCDRARSGYLAR
jgi:EAL domain-containing protein (putative c-di-GMP-specific phosphodiesterase class I)